MVFPVFCAQAGGQSRCGRTPPGAHGCYRDDLLKKIYTLKWGMENDVMFGRDTYADDYDVQWMKDLIAQDTAILNGLGVSEQLQQQYFCGNLMRFLG